MKFENGEIDELGNLKNKLCPFTDKDRNCGGWCPHFKKPEELFTSKRTINPETLYPVYTYEKTSLYTLQICNGTKINLGKILM